MAFKQFSYALLLSLFLISACNDEEQMKVIYIKPSSSNVCPVEFCLTLSQFAAIQRELNSSNIITLNFLLGNHTLNTTLVVADITKLSMIANSSVNISCQYSARLSFKNITQVSLQGLQFIGCGSNEISSIEDFTVENSSFVGKNGSGTALRINQSGATFANCSFLFNIIGTHIGPLQVILFWRKRPNYDILTDSNYAFVGGAIMMTHSNVTIFGSRFQGNHADIGGTIYANSSAIMIKGSRFTENSGCKNTSKFCFGGVIYNENDNANEGSSKQIMIVDCFFYNNTARYGGVFMLFKYCNISINQSRFHNNVASDSSHSQTHSGTGVMELYEQSTATIDECEFLKNGQWDGAVVAADNSAVTVRNSTFRDNIAEFGSAILITRGNVTAQKSFFYGNHAFQGGALNADEKCLVSICDCVFDSNFGEHFNAESVTSGGAIMMTNGGRLNITRTLFHNNTAARGGAISVSSNVEVIVVNCSFSGNGFTALQGGAIELSHSDITFIGKSNMTNNTAVNGGAVYAASDSVLSVYGELLISKNAAVLNASGAGGGVYLYRAKFNCQINSTVTILKNKAASNGGGIFAINSIVTVFSDRDSNMMSLMDFRNNTADKGGGIYLELAAELHVIKSGNNYTKMIYNYRFFANSASAKGGAIYNADETNYKICSSESYYDYNTSVGSECFLQIRSPMETFDMKYNVIAIEFLNNMANGSGQVLYGGLLDRCTIVPGAEIYLARHRIATQGIPYILNVSNLNTTDVITSSPVALCFCEPTGQPNCSYQLPSFNVTKGEKFRVSLVAVDQVNRTLPNITVYSSLKHAESGLDEGQMAQITSNNCTDFNYTIYSRDQSEVITLYADGPCRNATLSQKKVNVTFKDCTCPPGFHPNKLDKSNCICDCDPKIQAYVSKCQTQTKTLIRKGNVWINYLNDTNTPNDYNYLIYPYCPLDYCLPPSSNVLINLSDANGADTQCANNRSGMLCASCQPGLSLSLGSSRCVQCSRSWRGYLPLTLLAAVFAGILLIAVILVLKLTVAVGTLNGLIFYANIIDSSSVTFFPSSSTKLFYVLLKWLNLEIGLDVCFYDGMTTYWKTWLQLAFPLYVIVLVIIIIVMSRYSKRFSDLIGNQNPIATLATLILLSYTKLLRVIITALSMVTLHYPDGSHETRWLPDATIDYSDGKHIIMVLTAIFILTIGIAFTLLLFLWQWIVRWVKITEVHHFVEPYLAPYLSKHRYWTGLLLLARVTIYLTISLNGTGDPSINLLAIIVITSILLFIKGHFGQIYCNWKIDLIEMVCYLNILLFSSVKMFTIEGRNDTIPAFISGSIMLLLLFFILAYHTVHFNVCSCGCIMKLKRKMHRNYLSMDASTDGHQREQTTTCTVIDGQPHRNNPLLNTTRGHDENLEDITGQLFRSVDNGRSQASSTADADDVVTPLLNDTRRSTSKYTY